MCHVRPYIYIFKILTKASVRAETRTYGTDTPSRSKSRALSITPLHHPRKKTPQWRTSSTLDSIHTGVIGRCCHVHLKHQIHGANWKTPFCSPKGNQYWLRHLIQGVNWTILYKDRKKGVRINSKSLERQVYAPRLEPTAPIRLADRNHAHYPSRHCTIPKKRRLNDGLPAHLIRSTRESSEDVTTYTWSTKSMVPIEKKYIYIYGMTR